MAAAATTTPLSGTPWTTCCLEGSPVDEATAAAALRTQMKQKLKQETEQLHKSAEYNCSIYCSTAAAAGFTAAPLSSLESLSRKESASQENSSKSVENGTTGGLGQLLHLTVIVTGIYAFFLMYGYYQEQLYRIVDPFTGERFSYSFCLVFILCVSNTIFSFAFLLVKHQGDVKEVFGCVDSYLLREVLLISLTYVGAMLSTNYAMNHVTYPTQVLVKSAKMVPIVVGGLLVFRKTYPWYDYLSVTIVTISLVLFNFSKASGRSASTNHTESTGTGLLLLCVSLLCDGLTGPRQDRLMARYKKAGPVLLMFLTNTFSVAWTGLATAIIEGKAPYVLLQHEEGDVLSCFLAFSISGSLGQLFIYQSLRAFGSLYTSLFTTLRKATSTVLSVYMFGHHMTSIQWGSMAAIFATLMVQSYCSKKSKIRDQTKNLSKKGA